MQCSWNTMLWQQFDASLLMFKQSLDACREECWEMQLWVDETVSPELSQFWYIAYHTLFWLDLYLSGAVEGFRPPEPFTLDELDPEGIAPDPACTKAELQAYFEHGRQKCHTVLSRLTAEQAWQPCSFPWGDISFVGLLVDSIRHVQEHGGQLRMFLGQQIQYNPRWFAQVNKE